MKDCPHSARERTYSGDECPVCLAADRDKLQEEVERLKRGLYEIQSTSVSSRMKDYQALPEKAAALLAGEESSMAERLLQEHVEAHKKTAKKLEDAELQLSEAREAIEKVAPLVGHIQKGKTHAFPKFPATDPDCPQCQPSYPDHSASCTCKTNDGGPLCPAHPITVIVNGRIGWVGDDCSYEDAFRI